MRMPKLAEFGAKQAERTLQEQCLGSSECLVQWLAAWLQHLRQTPGSFLLSQRARSTQYPLTEPFLTLHMKTQLLSQNQTVLNCSCSTQLPS